MPRGVRGQERMLRLSVHDAAPGRRLAIVEVEADAESSGAVAIGEAFRRILEAGAAIRGITCTEEGGQVLCIGTLDVTDLRGDVKAVAASLSEVAGIRNVDVEEGPLEGFAAARGLILEAAGARVLITGAKVLAGLLHGAKKYLGDDAGAAFVYYEGFFAGRAAGENLSQLGSAAAIMRLMRVLEARGYGTPIDVLSDPNGGHYRFEVGRLIECEVLSKYVTGRARTSNFFRGMIAGALSVIEGGEWDVEEVECINDGSDKCAFEARRKKGSGEEGAPRSAARH